MKLFPTKKEDIYALLDQIDPERYARTRNYVDGAVSYLSPYISRGILSTRDVFEHLKKQNLVWTSVEKFVQELAWRDYFQGVWMRLGEAINSDIKQPQFPVRSQNMPQSVFDCDTGIQGVDKGIRNLIETGYMHNHQRMYVASLVCNVAQCHWQEAAKWMYFYLLDGDWASNACSWQWVAGSFSNKKYYANQENINRYCRTDQVNTYLDFSYEDLPQIDIPGQLVKTRELNFVTNLPQTDDDFCIQSDLPVLIYNWYNLDFEWYKNENVNRVLLLEPDVFKRHPISNQSVKFMMDLAKNIPEIKIFQGSFKELKLKLESPEFIFKEHPLNHYEGSSESRRFLAQPTNKKFNSFFGFWKSIEKQLKSEFEETMA